MKKFDSINVIPFVDILLVLLAIVLMTSSFIAKGVIPVSLPHASASTPVELNNVMISIDEQGGLFYEKESVSLEALMEKLSRVSEESHFALHCDKNAPFHFFVSVLDLLNKKQFKNIEIVTEK